MDVDVSQYFKGKCMHLIFCKYLYTTSSKALKHMTDELHNHVQYILKLNLLGVCGRDYSPVGYLLTASYLTKHENQIVFHTVKQEVIFCDKENILKKNNHLCK